MDSIEFLESIFGTYEGYLFISTKAAPSDTEITIHKSFKWPESKGTVEKYLSMRDDEDVYFSPMLYTIPRRRQSSVSHTAVLYADTDSFPVDGFHIPASINIETSPGRHASIWLLDQEYPPEAVSAASRAIALTHAKTENGQQVGTDPSGWDLTQLLRMPNSTNLKYLVKNKYAGYTQPYPVFVDDSLSPMTIYTLEDITSAYDPDNLPAMPERANMDVPDESTLPPVADVLRKVMSSRNLSSMYERKPTGDDDKSAMLYHFISECLRAGFTPEETFVAAWGAECNKYRILGRPRDDLWNYDMRNALADPKNRPRATVEQEADDSYRHPKDAGISTAVEFALLNEDEFPTRTWIDEYVAWASSKTDAPPQYHVASALTILSCVFGDYGVAPPKFGDLNLGLSFVVMGETTETRKSTTRNLMKTVLHAMEDDDHDYLLTSDATEEALIDALNERPNQSSLYDRDEAQKLIADVKGGKGYMKGFLETLNELYDGFARGRLRAAKATKGTPVVFIQYFMGIRSQIQENLELSDFASGWGPRQIWIRGETPPRTRENSLLEQQPRDGAGVADNRAFDSLITRLKAARAYWEDNYSPANKYKMFFDDDAWTRMANLEWDLTEYFEGHKRIEILRPCLQRLANNAIKVATLFAMVQTSDTVKLQDVINTRAYVARWVEDLLIMVEGVNQSLYAREINNLEKWIISKDGLVTSAAAAAWAYDSGKTLQEYKEMVKALEEKGAIDVVEAKGGKLSLRIRND